MDIQALGILSSITMQENVNVVRNTGNDFREVFEKNHRWRISKRNW